MLTIARAGSLPSHTARRVSESSTISITTIPSLIEITNSRQPSLSVTTTSDSGRTSMIVSPILRPILPPLRSASPPIHQPTFLQHPVPQPNYMRSRFHDSYNNSSPSSAKRPRLSPPPPITQPAKRQSKWTTEEDTVMIELRGAGMKWQDISKRLPGRSVISCRLHYQNYLERRSQWDDEKKNRLARLYERLKAKMWRNLAAELGVPWRAAEAMHWQLGEKEMSSRAGVTPFSLTSTQAQPWQSSFHMLAASSQPEHYRQHSDPAFESMYNQQHHRQSFPGPGLAYLPPLPGSMIEEEAIRRHSRPPSPMIKLSPGQEQQRRTIPSMAELDQGLPIAARGDAYRNSSYSRSQ